jgi:hypothetical protein
MSTAFGRLGIALLMEGPAAIVAVATLRRSQTLSSPVDNYVSLHGGNRNDPFATLLSVRTQTRGRGPMPLLLVVLLMVERRHIGKHIGSVRSIAVLRDELRGRFVGHEAQGPISERRVRSE